MILLALAAVAIALLAAATSAPADQGSRFRPAVESRHGVIATESYTASRIGRSVLQQGGNAVDAAVAAVFGVSVARPQSCGIGGGGFMVYRSARGRVSALDFRETAPDAITADAFQGDGIYDQFSGHKTVGVPGTVAGLDAALRRFGTLSLGKAIRPAKRIAREGFRVPASLSKAMTDNAERLRMFPAAAEQFLIAGATPYPPGSTLIQEDLARTLGRLQRLGAREFYTGETARLIAKDMRENSGRYPGDEGLVTEADIARYQAKWRPALSGSYRGRQVVGMPAPTSGGIATIQMLNLLEGFDLRAAGQSSADALHLIAEAQKIAFADRGAYVADPAFVDVPQRELISKQYADRRRTEIDPRTAKSYQPGNPRGTQAQAATAMGGPAGTTTHISVVDAAGNAVALTCTIEQEFGSAVVAPGTGFLLNNEMTDFGAPGTANAAAPRKRPRSSMSPTIVVRRDRPVLVHGGAGGVRIIMGVLLPIVNTVDFGLDIAHAVDAERLDANRGGSRPIFLEDIRVPDPVEADLISRGHQIEREGEYGLRPRVQAAGYSLARGRLQAVADPRTDFAALAVKRAPRRR